MYLKKYYTLILSLLLFSNITFAQDSTKYGPGNYELKAGNTTQLTLVYIGANGCGPCHLPSLKKAVEKLKIVLSKRAKEQRKKFSAIGIANDFDVKKGWKFLNSSGYFDEIIVGKNWLNTGSIEFIWNRKKPKPSMPQVIVFERKIEIGDSIQVGEKKYLAQYAGSAEIEQWVNNGAKFSNQ